MPTRFENSVSPPDPKQREPEDYDKRCVEIPGVDEMSVDELTKVIVDLYGLRTPK